MALKLLNNVRLYTVQYTIKEGTMKWIIYFVYLIMPKK